MRPPLRNAPWARTGPVRRIASPVPAGAPDVPAADDAHASRRLLVDVDPNAPHRTRVAQQVVAEVLNSLIRQGRLVRGADGEWDFALTSDHVEEALGFTPVPDTVQIVAGPGLCVEGTLVSGTITMALKPIITPAEIDLDPIAAGSSFSVDRYGRVFRTTGGLAVTTDY
jgi:hypothetical protein